MMAVQESFDRLLIEILNTLPLSVEAKFGCKQPQTTSLINSIFVGVTDELNVEELRNLIYFYQLQNQKSQT